MTEDKAPLTEPNSILITKEEVEELVTFIEEKRRKQKMSRCVACDELFEWNDDVVIVDDEVYHKDCVELYPIGYYAMLDGEPLGETENEDGQMACDIIGGLLDD